MANQIEPTRAIGGLMAALMGLIKRRRTDSNAKSQSPTSFGIAGYTLVLLDRDGQVAWTREWDAGSTFEFGPRHSLWVFCEFTNQSKREIEIAEYEIELTSNEGIVVERFGKAFADSLIVAPGETKVFSGQWRL
jgi:hypothetical protein